MLETEIKKLNENIEHLNRLLESMADTAVKNANTASTPSPTADQSSTSDTVNKDETSFGHDDIKTMALAITRKDRSKRDAIKEKLSEYGANVATDLSDDATQAVGAWLAGLKESVAA